jgi:peroxiredoxin
MVRRLREAMTKLDLSNEQKQKVDALLNDVQDKARELRREAQGDAQALREKGRQLIQDSRAKLQEVLSPDQQAKLRELMQQRQRGRGNDETAPATAPTTKPSDKSGEKSGGGGAMAPPLQPSNERLAVGQQAPAFRVTKLDGTAVQLDSFQGKLALIAFGSYSSPSFRQRILSLEDLRREYGSRVSFLIIYTREAHPAGQWEVDRNREQQISIPDHKDLSQRKEMAKQARTKLKINIPLAVDSMEDEAARAYHACPNDAALLIDKDGTVLAYQQWFDAYGMKQAMMEALSNKPRVQPTSAPTTEPQVK